MSVRVTVQSFDMPVTVVCHDPTGTNLVEQKVHPHNVLELFVSRCTNVSVREHEQEPLVHPAAAEGGMARLRQSLSNSPR